MATIIVGGVVKKDGKYLLVQEAKKECKGKWSIPAGHLEPNETIVEGAKREILEECGLEVEITGILHVRKNSEWVNIAFSTNIIGGEIRFDKKEIQNIHSVSQGIYPHREGISQHAHKVPRIALSLWSCPCYIRHRHTRNSLADNETCGSKAPRIYCPIRRHICLR